MALDKIIVFAIVVSYFACEGIRQDAITISQRSQFLGVWYHLGVISSKPDNSIAVTCYRLNVTKEAGNFQNFRQLSTFKINGRPYRFDAYGKIINPEVHLLAPYTDGKAVYTMKSYNDGNNLIFRNEMLPPYFALLSRQPTVSSEMKGEFDTLAAIHGQRQAVYFHHEGCFY